MLHVSTIAPVPLWTQPNDGDTRSNRKLYRSPRPTDRKAMTLWYVNRYPSERAGGRQHLKNGSCRGTSGLRAFGVRSGTCRRRVQSNRNAALPHALPHWGTAGQTGDAQGRRVRPAQVSLPRGSALSTRRTAETWVAGPTQVLT